MRVRVRRRPRRRSRLEGSSRIPRGSATGARASGRGEGKRRDASSCRTVFARGRLVEQVLELEVMMRDDAIAADLCSSTL